jgi:hypothetical protein
VCMRTDAHPVATVRRACTNAISHLIPTRTFMAKPPLAMVRLIALRATACLAPGQAMVASLSRDLLQHGRGPPTIQTSKYFHVPRPCFVF